MTTAGYQEVKKYLKKCYGAELVESYEKEYGKDGFMEFARKTAKNGVQFKTPVFDGAQYDEDIKPLLEELNLPAVGAFKFRDGRTGEYFDQPVTVGIYLYDEIEPHG